jgi:hypothetical protein
MKAILFILMCLGGTATAVFADEREPAVVEVVFPGAEIIEAGEVIYMQAYDSGSVTYTIYTTGPSPAGPFSVTPENLFAATGKVPVVGARVMLHHDLKVTLMNALNMRRASQAR